MIFVHCFSILHLPYLSMNQGGDIERSLVYQGNPSCSRYGIIKNTEGILHSRHHWFSETVSIVGPYRDVASVKRCV